METRSIVINDNLGIPLILNIRNNILPIIKLLEAHAMLFTVVGSSHLRILITTIITALSQTL